MKFKKIKSRIADYVGATKNEILVDAKLFRLLDASPESCGHIPRVPKWIYWGRRRPALTRLLARTLRLLWIAGGAVVFFMLEFIPLWLRAKGRAARVPPAPDTPTILALSSRAESILMSPAFKGDPRFTGASWMCLPWVPTPAHVAPEQRIDVFALLSRRDLQEALVDAVRAVYILWSHKRTAPWILQSYTAFRWFAVRCAVDKLRGALVMVEHFDRWAVLVDSSVSRRQPFSGVGRARNETSLSLIQHGYVGSLGAQDRLPVHRPLRAVDRIHVYDAAAEQMFKDAMLSTGCVRRGVLTEYFEPTIELFATPAATGPRILFVGHPMCEQLHLEVRALLGAALQFSGYYKPHPQAAQSGEVALEAWTIVKDKCAFPAVDLLVSYPSTLVKEYESAGVPAVVHALDWEASNAEELVAQILRHVVVRDSVREQRG